jgi:hypothetical protein
VGGMLSQAKIVSETSSIFMVFLPVIGRKTDTKQPGREIATAQPLPIGMLETDWNGESMATQQMR